VLGQGGRPWGAAPKVCPNLRCLDAVKCLQSLGRARELSGSSGVDRRGAGALAALGYRGGRMAVEGA